MSVHGAPKRQVSKMARIGREPQPCYLHDGMQHTDAPSTYSYTSQEATLLEKSSIKSFIFTSFFFRRVCVLRVPENAFRNTVSARNHSERCRIAKSHLFHEKLLPLLNCEHTSLDRVFRHHLVHVYILGLSYTCRGVNYQCER